MNVGDRVVFKADVTTRPLTARCGTVREAKTDGWLLVEFDHLPGFMSVQHPAWIEVIREGACP